VASKLCAYEETGLAPEEAAGLWIYGSVLPPDSDFEKTIHAVEEALGFKLFVWQKNYLAYGEFRQMGVTTAKILQELLDVSGAPIDYSRSTGSAREKFYRGEIQKIKKKLDDAGIPTRKVFFSERDKRKEGVNVTIEEAIAHAREVAEGCPAEDRQCAYQHDKLCDWLEELKTYKATGLTPEEIVALQASFRELKKRSCAAHASQD